MPRIEPSQTKQPFSSAYSAKGIPPRKETAQAKKSQTQLKDKAMAVKPEMPKEKLPDFAPRPQNWDDFPAQISSGNMYALVDANTKRPLDEIAKDLSVPILAFTGTLLQEIRYITKSLPNSEHAVFLALRRIDENRPHFLAYDFFMPEQSASGGGVSLDPKDCQRHFDKLKEHPWYRKNGTHRHLCHLHSHAGMGVFWSSVDNTQQLSRDDLGFMDDFRFYCVVNTKDEIKCSLVLYKPVLARVDAVVAVSYAGDGHAEQLTKKRRNELEHIVKTAMSQSGTALFREDVSEFEKQDRSQESRDAKYPGFSDWRSPNPGRGGVSWNNYYWGTDSVHRYAGDDGWDDDAPSQAKKGRVEDVKERKLRLDLVPVPPNKAYTDIEPLPAELCAAFMRNANVDKMSPELMRILRALVGETGVILASVNRRTGEVMEDGENPAAVGELFADYLCELSELIGNPLFFETAMPEFVDSETIRAIAGRDRTVIFKRMVKDLTDLIDYGACME